MKAPLLIANVPMSIYKGPVHVGYLAYLVPLDTLARFHRVAFDSEVLFHRDCYNVLGKLVEGLLPEDGQPLADAARDYVQKWLASNRIGPKLGLFGEETLTDDYPASHEASRKAIRTLNERGFLITRDSELLIDIPRINKVHNLERILEQTAFHPQRIEGEVTRFIDTHSSTPIPITRTREFSVDCPEELVIGRKLAPIFVLATMWDGQAGGVHTFTCSENNLLKYGLLRLISEIGMSGTTNTSNVYVFNRQLVEGGVESWDYYAILASENGLDGLRYAVLRATSQKEQKTWLREQSFEDGKRLMQKIYNLSVFFARQGTVLPPAPVSALITELMSSYRFADVVRAVEEKVKHISHRVDSCRVGGSLQQNVETLAREYAQELAHVSFLFPNTYKRIRGAHDR